VTTCRKLKIFDISIVCRIGVSFMYFDTSYAMFDVRREAGQQLEGWKANKKGIARAPVTLMSGDNFSRQNHECYDNSKWLGVPHYTSFCWS
jgi:hypothetical protein